MNDRITDRDIVLISSYIDLRLSPAENEKVRARLKSDPKFKQLLDELTYTRRLLQALPPKRAPRNFTLSPEKVRIPRRTMWLQPALSFVSIAAAVMLVVVFSSSYLLGGARTAAPKVPAPESAMFAAENAVTSEEAPQIINWNPILGMGGGADPKAEGLGGGGAGGPGWDISDTAVGGGTSDAGEDILRESPEETEIPSEPDLESPEQPAPLPEETSITEEPPLTAMAAPEDVTSPDSTAGADLSTLILGIPAEEVQGQMLAKELESNAREESQRFPRALLMIISGVVAVLAGAAALFLRRY